MYVERQDYSYLLDSLRSAYNSYKENQNQDDIDMNAVRFSILYCLAYRTLHRMESIDPADNMTEYYFNKALSDYSIFNSFMNNCSNEYKIYDDIGTGHITYAPYESLASYIFSSPVRKRVFTDFLSGKNAVINFDNGPKKVK